MTVCYSRNQVLALAQEVVGEAIQAQRNRTLAAWSGEIRATDQTAQTVFWMRRGGGPGDAVLHLLRSHVLACEALHPGSGEICALVASQATSEWIRRERAGASTSTLREEFSDLCDRVSAHRQSVRRVREEDLSHMLARVPVGVRKELISTILSLPMGCTVAVRKGLLPATSVSRSSGCAIRLGSAPGCATRARLVDPKIVLLDGTIDSVGQVHRILEDSASQGTSYLVVCRGAAEDVLRTVSVNCARGTIKVSLLLSRLDDLTIGALEDTAAYTGSWVINAQCGESISTAFDRLTSVKGRAWYEDGQLRIEGDPDPGLERHLTRLRDEALSGDQSVSDFLNPRILGMSSARVELVLGTSDTRSSPTIVESLDSDMRSLAAALIRGVSDEWCAPDNSPGWVVDCAEEVGTSRVMCAGSASSGIASGIRFARDLCTIGHAVF
jgi:hypothetical protein